VIIDVNSVDKLRHTRPVAYSVELVLLNKHRISGGGAYLHCYLIDFRVIFANFRRLFAEHPSHLHASFDRTST